MVLGKLLQGRKPGREGKEGVVRKGRERENGR